MAVAPRAYRVFAAGVVSVPSPAFAGAAGAVLLDRADAGGTFPQAAPDVTVPLTAPDATTFAPAPILAETTPATETTEAPVPGGPAQHAPEREGWLVVLTSLAGGCAGWLAMPTAASDPVTWIAGGTAVGLLLGWLALRWNPRPNY